MVNGKSYISEEALPKIVKKLNVTFQWLLTKDEYHQQDFDAHRAGTGVVERIGIDSKASGADVHHIGDSGRTF